MTKAPTEAEVGDALRLLGRYPPDCTCDGDHENCPVRDFVDAEDTLRAALAARPSEADMLRFTADWLDNALLKKQAYGIWPSWMGPAAHAIRAEADRREKNDQ